MAHALARAAISRGLATARVLTAIDIVSPLVGATEAAIAALFAAARTAAPCLVIIDGLDVLSPARRRSNDDDDGGGASGRASGVTATLLAELDGVLASGGVSLIGIVRDAKMLDAAMTRPGRLDVHVELRAPNDSERAALLESAPGGSPAASRWKARIKELVAFTQAWSRADTVDLWRSAAMNALRRVTSNEASRGSVLVTDEDIDVALATSRAVAGDAPRISDNPLLL
jgi:SpoVK/Ycf46/Vps4 family AAA+-type ATPase